MEPLEGRARPCCGAIHCRILLCLLALHGPCRVCTYALLLFPLRVTQSVPVLLTFKCRLLFPHRESCNLDTLPLVQNIRRRLNVSHGILSDALPSHVLAALLSGVGEDNHFLQDGTDDGVEDQAQAAREPMPPFPLLHQPADCILRSPENEIGTNVLLAAGGGCFDLGDKGSRQRARDRGAKATPDPAFIMDKQPCEAACAPSGGVAPLPRPRSFNNSQMAARHECVTIFISDICSFSAWAHTVPPEAVMQTLNDLYTRLDRVILKEMPSLYKVETIGDAYIVAGNLFDPDPQHAATMTRFALRAREEAAKVLRPDVEDGSTVQLRIGVWVGADKDEVVDTTALNIISNLSVPTHILFILLQVSMAVSQFGHL